MNNLPYEQRKLALIEEINAAFDGVSREGGVSLSEAWAIDYGGSDEERAEARREDTEKRWQDVPDEDITNGSSCLSFLDEIGFRYYIPAYMVWFLRYTDNEDPDFNNNTFVYLLYALEKGNTSMGFTIEQSRAIAHFLLFDAEREDELNREYQKEKMEILSKEGYSPEEIAARQWTPPNDARHALEKYWGQFL